MGAARDRGASPSHRPDAPDVGRRPDRRLGRRRRQHRILSPAPRAGARILVGFSVTRHCNLRCPHCIRADVTDVQVLPARVVADVTDQARDLFDSVRVSLTGGEPLIHPRFDELAALFGEREVPWRFTTNGWHLRRSMAALDRHPPTAVRLSLSGATEETHDGERGRGSFRRLLEAVALLTSRRIPIYLSFIVDRRTREELSAAADLAEDLGCTGLSYICPQPVPGSAARGSDLPPEAWPGIRRELEALAAEPGRKTRLTLDYGFPFEGRERPCDTFALKRIYVDPEGRLCACCQLSEYGTGETEVVADLTTTPLAEALDRYRAHLAAQRRATAPDRAPEDPHAAFPCMRCAKAHGKLAWLKRFPDSSWHGAADMAGVESLQEDPPTEEPFTEEEAAVAR